MTRIQRGTPLGDDGHIHRQPSPDELAGHNLQEGWADLLQYAVEKRLEDYHFSQSGLLADWYVWHEHLRIHIRQCRTWGGMLADCDLEVTLRYSVLAQSLRQGGPTRLVTDVCEAIAAAIHHFHNRNQHGGQDSDAAGRNASISDDVSDAVE